jgi:hypothetical protein
MDDNVKRGSFIVETQKHLQGFENPALRFYRATLFAGKAGRLLGKLRGQEVISDIDKVGQFAAEAGDYDDYSLKNSTLPTLEKYGCIEIYWDSAGNIDKIEENIPKEDNILKIVSEIWEAKNPTTEEQASFDAVDYCSRLPRVESELKGHIASLGYSKTTGIELAKNFKVLQEYKLVPGIDESVYHTPLFVRENIISIANTIHRLPTEEKEKLDDLFSSTKSTEANPLSQLSIDRERLLTYNKIGIIDITNVKTINGRTEGFLFTPAIWGPLGSALTRDEQEHVRALLSCIRLGQICPTKVDGKEYRINNPEAYIEALERKGRIGPATPIGSDYIILEREGIVKIEKSKSKTGQFEMVLLKEDIAERAKRIISMGRDISVYDGTIDAKPLSQVGDFRNTAQSRIDNIPKIKKTGERSELLEKEIIKLIRGEKD